MSDYEVKAKFDANAARSALERAINGKVAGLRTDNNLYKGLLEDYFNAKSPYLLKYIKDSGAFSLGNKASDGVESKKNPKFERFGEVRYTTKGLIIDPISVYKPTGSSSHYGEAAAYAHPYEFDTLMYQPGTEGWDDFIELARKRVLNYMRGKKNGHK